MLKNISRYVVQHIKLFAFASESALLCSTKRKRYMIMKRIVVLIDSKFKQAVCAYLDLNRVQYSMFTCVCTAQVRVFVPHAKGVRFLAELRRDSIPYELI